MSASFVCQDCLPEGSDLGFADLKAGTPRHCHRRNDRVLRGVLGGFRCACKCCWNDPEADR